VSNFTFEDWELAQFIEIFKRARPSFYNDATCIEEESPGEWFFPGQGQAPFIKKGLAVCRRCPVQKTCFLHAMSISDEHGVWGGSTPDQRREWIIDGLTGEEAWEKLMESEALEESGSNIGQ